MSKNTDEVHSDFEDKPNTFNEIFLKGQTYKDVLGKKEIWKELEKEHKGKLEILITKSFDGATLKLEIPYKNYLVVLIETDTMPLKAEVQLTLRKEFEFNINLEDWTDRIAFLLGKKDVITGENEFDKKYRIKSNDEKNVLQLLYRKVTNLVLENEIYALNLKKEKKTNISKLLIVKDRNTKEKSKLNDLIVLSFTLIDNLINQGLLTIN